MILKKSGEDDLEKERAELEDNVEAEAQKEIDKILRIGADNARKIAEPVLKQVKELVGFVI